MNTTWLLIVNPTAGNNNFNTQCKLIKKELTKNNINYVYKNTKHAKHDVIILKEAIKKGYQHFITVGGDGTLHNTVNDIMQQNNVYTNKIIVTVMTLSTGNDRIKTYKTPNNVQKTIQIIRNKNTVYQDIGFLELNTTTVYFNNVAGIGYDAYVVNNLKKLKRLCSIAYLLSGLKGMISYKKKAFKITVNNKIIETKCLMTVFWYW